MEDLSRRTCAYKAADPWGSFAYAIFERAVADLTALRRAGIVRGWECVSPYPMWEGKPLRVNSDYHRTCQVNELLDYFKKGWCEKTLRFLGSAVDNTQIMRYLEDKTNQQEVAK